jgi:hypothetical protein
MRGSISFESPKWALAIHGGTGVVERARMPPGLESEYVRFGSRRSHAFRV